MTNTKVALREIQSLLGDLGITKVVWVDDEFDSAAEDDVVAQILALYPQIKPRLLEFAELNPSVREHLNIFVGNGLKTDGVVKGIIRRSGNKLPPELGAGILALAVLADASATEESTTDAKALVGLESLLPSGLYQAVKVADWPTLAPTLLAPGHDPVLIFLDRNLGDKGGDLGGERLLAKLREDYPNAEHAYFGLFTQDALDAPQEGKIAEPLIKQLDIAVAVMGKYRVKNALEFAEGLRVFLYTRDLHVVRKHLIRAVKTSMSAAEELISSMGFYALMTSSMAAYAEGSLEAEGVLRMARGEIRRQLDISLRDRAPADETARIRSVLSKGKATGLHPTSPLAELDWNDRFDSPVHLATCHLPLEAGDIFEFELQDGTIQPYILLVQACDLMVRAKGYRTNAPPAFVLAAMREKPVAGGLGEKYFSIGRWDVASDADWVVDLTSKIAVTPEILDACVLTSDGTATLGPDTSVPSGLTAGWLKRAMELEKWRAKLVIAAAELVAMLPADFLGAERAAVVQSMTSPLMGPGFASTQIKSDVDPESGIITASIKRVGHLVESRARALIWLASMHQARADQDGPLFDEKGQPYAPAVS